MLNAAFVSRIQTHSKKISWGIVPNKHGYILFSSHFIVLNLIFKSDNVLLFDVAHVATSFKSKNISKETHLVEKKLI